MFVDAAYRCLRETLIKTKIECEWLLYLLCFTRTPPPPSPIPFACYVVSEYWGLSLCIQGLQASPPCRHCGTKCFWRGRLKLEPGIENRGSQTILKSRFQNLKRFRGPESRIDTDSGIPGPIYMYM